ITVTNVNETPVIADIPDQTIEKGEKFTVINLDKYVSDVDNSDEDMVWNFSGNIDLHVSITDRIATITIPDNWTGSETITFIATDFGGLSDQDTATFTVTTNVTPEDFYVFLPMIVK